MTDAEEPPALAFIEKTLADSYRKEIDQEENVWRSLPFFAATLSLQLAALFQMIDKLPVPTTLAGKISIVVLLCTGILTLLSLGFLAASIYPQRFDYIASEPALLTYAQDLVAGEQSPANAAQEDPISALVTLKTELAWQYAEGADHNRQINKRRERRRSVAGLAALGSVAMTVLLVATTYAHYLSSHEDKEPGYAAPRSVPIRPTAQESGLNSVRPPGKPSGAPAAADARGHQGVVDAPRGAGERGGSGKDSR